MTPTEQLNHIADGDYEWCPDCNGAGAIDEPRGCLASYRCDLCDGDGIVFCGDDEPASIEALAMVGRDLQNMEREAA